MQNSHEQVKKDINIYIYQVLSKKVDLANDKHKDYRSLWQSILTLHKAGGKRLRPQLLINTYRAYGGKKIHDILPIAASVELLHSAMLVHDDVIDNDYIRHGVKNISGIYQSRYKNLKNPHKDTNHLANSVAILAGDLLLSESYQSILKSNISNNIKIETIKLLGEAIEVTIAGQLLDTESVLFPIPKTNSLLTAKLKTSYYSFVLPLLLGSMLSETKFNNSNELVSIGTALGVAYQLSDDLQGVFGKSIHTGKQDFGDIREGKRTYLLQLTYELANSEQKKLIYSIIDNNKCDSAMAKKLQQIMYESGARKIVENKIQELEKQAIDTIDLLPIGANGIDLLKYSVNLSSKINDDPK